jgi:acetyl-CoA acetyltransferase
MGFSEQVFADFAAVAVDNALKDAAIEWQKIQSIMAGIFIYGGNAGHLSGQYLETIFGETGVPVVNVYNACATGSAAIRMAYNSVAAGETDTALAFGADVSPQRVSDRQIGQRGAGQGRNPLENGRHAQSHLLGTGMPQTDGKIRHHRRGSGNGQGPDERARLQESGRPV